MMPIGARSKTLPSWKIKMPKMTMRLGESPLTHCMLSRICANHKIQSLLLGTTSERQKKFLFYYPHTLTIRLKRPVYRGFSGEGKCEGVRVKFEFRVVGLQTMKN